MQTMPKALISLNGKKLDIHYVPDFATMRSIEYHWLTGKIKKIVFRPTKEILEIKASLSGDDNAK